MKAAERTKNGSLLMRAWQRIRYSRSRALLIVVGLAGGLLLVVTQWPTGVVGKCRTDAGPSVDWSDCRKSMLMLDHSRLDGAKFTGADLSRTDLNGSSLKKVDFTKANLMRASLSKADAEGAVFQKVEGYRGEFSEIKADGSTFVSAEMQRANFAGAVLTNTDFTKAELGRVIFSQATLGNTRFATVNLSRATFQNAKVTGPVDFTDAFLFLTRIEGVDLSQASGLEQEQLGLACGDAATVLPPGLTRPANWPCREE
ncbi:pentapeptide repeat-containing protein [Rhizobium sp. SAFR-030]|uniref:pentapeptide repeat-containing protein n=1 Tax=Rhizobium sp. SAFR-030 TaxID=3387277 RepID=UPI003F7D6969